MNLEYLSKFINLPSNEKDEAMNFIRNNIKSIIIIPFDNCTNASNCLGWTKQKVSNMICAKTKLTISEFVFVITDILFRSPDINKENFVNFILYYLTDWKNDRSNFDVKYVFKNFDNRFYKLIFDFILLKVLNKPKNKIDYEMIDAIGRPSFVLSLLKSKSVNDENVDLIKAALYFITPHHIKLSK